MIIDSHVHLAAEGWYTRNVVIRGIQMSLAAMAKSTGEYPDAEELVDSMMPLSSDSTGEKLVARMDAVGVGKSCIFAVDLGLVDTEPDVAIEEQNRMIGEAAKRFPDRLIPFFTVDPRRPGGLEMFRRGVEDWGMRGLKLHPGAGFYPYDLVVYPFYEKCMEYDIPVLFHTGVLPGPMKSRFARPLNVDDVAADFPDLPIIMAHVANEMWEEALGVAGVKPNIYFDISGWQMPFNSRPQHFYRMLRAVLDKVGPWRVFFGSDSPGYDLLCPFDRWVKALVDPDLGSCPEISFTAGEIDTVMGKAAAKLLILQ